MQQCFMGNNCIVVVYFFFVYIDGIVFNCVVGIFFRSYYLGVFCQ